MAIPRPARIAVFDSGVGGLTVLAAIHRALPELDLRFLGDTARLPYGTKSAHTVERYALQAAESLLRDGDVDVLVVACNTASSCALPALRQRFDIEVLGVIEPGAAAAVAATRTGHVGVVGTERTVASGAYAHAVAALDPAVSVHARATPLLVSLAEEGWFDHPATDAALRAYLLPWLGDPAVQQIDTLVLGCTHYPVFALALSRVLGDLLDHPVRLVDSAEPIARLLARRFAGAPGQGTVELFATDSIERFERVGGLFFPMAHAQVALVDL
ncbi:MAG: glutamate racemase [Deltaproteobacteria bacterium]|nr:glutamate racemase [Deltaproteobacteria bacterium]